MKQTKSKDKHLNFGLRFTGLIIAYALISACSTEFENPVEDTTDHNSGTTDLSKFVTIGDSLTAGYADGALYIEGQKNSYPAILAQQFAKVGGGEFTQPLVSDNLGGLLIGGNPDPVNFPTRRIFDANPKNPPEDLDPIGPVFIEGTPTTEVFANAGGTLYNNVGVPGAKSFHLVSSSYGVPAGLAADPVTSNPYFVRFASASNASMIGDAAAQQPSFFILWIGNNDVLSFALAGGDGVDQGADSADPVDKFDPATYSANDITNPTVFTNVYNGLVSALTAANASAKGVLLNIPDVSALPYFTTVPYNAIPLDQATADTLNSTSVYGAYNGGLALALAGGAINQEEHDKRTINFSAGLQNSIVILDETLTDLTLRTDIDPALAGINKIRQATADDLIVLTAASVIGELTDPNDLNSTVWGVSAPLSDEHVLIPSEITAIETATAAFNTTIADAAAADSNLILVDVAAIMDEVKTTGINYGTGSIGNAYASGGTFSLDGVHPTARGYAVIANRIIDKINSSFSASIPPVDPGNYTTIFIK